MSRSPKRKSEEVVRTAPKGCFATPRSKSVYHGGGEYPIERDWPARLLASVSPGSGWERIADLLESERLDDAKQEWVSEQGPRILAVRVLNYLASENRAELDAHQWKGPSAELARLLGGLSRAGAAMYRKPTAEHVRKLRSYCADIRACLPSAKPAPEASGEKERPAYGRDHLWLGWYDDTNGGEYRSCGKVRDKWNAMSEQEREPYAPHNRKLPRGKPGWDRVRKGIAKAQKER
jgi:hypothetical protein